MSNLPKFQQIQLAFTNRIRYRDKASLPSGVSAEQMTIYKDCFLNGIKELLENCFPILTHILEKNQLWHDLASKFYAEHPTKSPFFYEVPEAFLTYLIEHQPLVDDFPYLLDLAHYEWMELALEIAEGNAPPALVNGQVNDNITVFGVSELAEIVAYQFPVDQINKQSLSKDINKEETYLCIYRNSEDQVKFLRLNQTTAKFLLILKYKPNKIVKVIKEIFSSVKEKDLKEWYHLHLPVFNLFLEKGIIYPLSID